MLKKLLEFLQFKNNTNQPAQESSPPAAKLIEENSRRKIFVHPKIKTAGNVFKAFPIERLAESLSAAAHVHEMMRIADGERAKIRIETGDAPNFMVLGKHVTVDGRGIFIQIEVLWLADSDGKIRPELSLQSKQAIKVYDQMIKAFLN